MLFRQRMQQEKIGMRVLAHFDISSTALSRSCLWCFWRKSPTPAWNAVIPIASNSTQPFTRCTPILAYTPLASRLLKGTPVSTICILDKTTVKAMFWISQTGFIWIGGPLRFLTNIYGSELVLTVLYRHTRIKAEPLVFYTLKSHGGFYV